jgi:membrane protein
MKTVCPHCHQKYDVPDDYLQQDVTCQKCEKDFTVTKAKFCSECGKANPAQAFQCYACLHPFRLKIYTETEDAASQHLISNASGDRSEAKLGLLLQIIVFIYGVGSGLAALQGVGMIFSAFSDYPELGNKGLTIIYGVAVVTVYGRLLLLLSTLTQPKKKAVQTPYSLFALLGGGILSIIGLIVSFTVFSGGQQAIYAFSNVLTLVFLYQIYHIWGERCLMDVNYEEPERSKMKSSTLGRISVILAVIGLLGGFIFAVPAIVMGIIAHKDGNKAGFIGMLLGILGLIGNIVFIIIIFGNH